VIGALFAGMRFPRSMLNGPANERLLEYLGVLIVDDCDAELEDYARAWLASTPFVAREPIATTAVRRALERIDRERAAA
jgi:hypothetical protein